MKITFTFAMLFAFSSAFAQQDMFWNNYSNVNPAMSGFQYEQHGAISYSDYFRKYKPKTLHANYNTRLADKHGLGLNFTGRSFSLNETSTILNYNYQFDLGKAGKVSTGIGAGFNSQNDNETYSTFDAFNIQAKIYFQLNLGVAYKWKQLTAGASVRNLTQPDLILDSGLVLYSYPSLNVLAEYDFSIGKQFQLTPRVTYSLLDGYHRLNTDLTLTFKNTFSLGTIFDFDDGVGLHAGWDINEKFRIAYLFNTNFSYLTSNILSHNHQHQVALGFILR